MPLVAGIIPTYGQFDYARIATESFLRSESDSVAIVVDDASPDWNDRWLEGLDETRIVQHIFDENRGLTRSWNWGIKRAHDIKAEFVVVGNSDLLFPENWFAPVRKAFRHGWEFLGPLTNAPGDRRKQKINRYVKDYELTDNPEYIKKLVDRLPKYSSENVIRERINGYCMIGRPKSWMAYGMFNEKRHPMTHQESSFFRNVSRSGGGNNIGIAMHSFVFHYRSVSKGLKRGSLDEGNFRP